MSDLPRFKMDISYPSAEKPAFVRHIATNSGEWVRFVDAEKRIAELEEAKRIFDGTVYGKQAERIAEQERLVTRLQGMLEGATERGIAAEAKLDAVRGLPDKWRRMKQFAPSPLMGVDILDGCAAELDTALGEDK